MAKKTMNYRTLDSLTPVRKVINEVAEALQNPSKTIKGSAIENVLVNVAGIVAIGAGAIGFAIARIGRFAAPVALLGAVGVGVALKMSQKKLTREKESLYKEALQQQENLSEELDNKDNLSSDRFDYINSLNILLSRIIDELEADLGIEKKTTTDEDIPCINIGKVPPDFMNFYANCNTWKINEQFTCGDTITNNDYMLLKEFENFLASQQEGNTELSCENCVLMEQVIRFLKTKTSIAWKCNDFVLYNISLIIEENDSASLTCEMVFDLKKMLEDTIPVYYTSTDAELEYLFPSYIENETTNIYTSPRVYGAKVPITRDCLELSADAFSIEDIRSGMCLRIYELDSDNLKDKKVFYDPEHYTHNKTHADYLDHTSLYVETTDPIKVTDVTYEFLSKMSGVDSNVLECLKQQLGDSID